MPLTDEQYLKLKGYEGMQRAILTEMLHIQTLCMVFDNLTPERQKRMEFLKDRSASICTDIIRLQDEPHIT